MNTTSNLTPAQQAAADALSAALAASIGPNAPPPTPEEAAAAEEAHERRCAALQGLMRRRLADGARVAAQQALTPSDSEAAR